MSRQQRSMASKNWRNSQAPSSDDISKVSRSLQSLSTTDARRNRAGTLAGQLPTINENDTFNPATPRQTINSAADMLAALGTGLQPAASSYSRGRNPSNFGQTNVSTLNERPAGSGQYTLSNGPGTSAGVGNVQRRQKLAKDEFRVGAILRAPLHEEDYMGTSRGADVTVASKFVSRSYAGAVFTKVRVMIVVACHKNHYTAVPLYTHNGNGLSKKTPAEKVEYVSIRDHRFAGKFTAQSENGFLRTEYLKQGIHVLDPLSAAHVTYSLPRKYDLPVVHQGYLTENSAGRLVQLYKRLALKKEDA